MSMRRRSSLSKYSSSTAWRSRCPRRVARWGCERICTSGPLRRFRRCESASSTSSAVSPAERRRCHVPVFVPTQLALLRNGAYHTLLPGVGELCKEWQKQGIKIGVTTGFTRQMLDLLLAGAAKQGFVPDTHCAATRSNCRVDRLHGRQNLERMASTTSRMPASHYQGRRHRIRRRRGRTTVLARRVSKWSNYVADSWDAVRKMSAGTLPPRAGLQGEAGQRERRALCHR